jgi:tetraacyldisaccharide 4'-kinase
MRALLMVYSRASRTACGVKALLFRLGWRRPRRASLPVVSIGNITLGGAGKTPLVMELIAWAQARGLNPAVVSRGYKGLWEKKGGILSDGKALRGGWREAGDEPVLVARRFPKAGVFVGRHRFLSCEKARELGFDLVILDDGFQHLKLSRDLDIVLHRPGAKAVLREGPKALRRAGIVLFDAEAGPAELPLFGNRPPRPLVFAFRIRPRDILDLGSGRLSPPESLSGKKAVAFCGLARPERFLDLLRGLSLEVAESLAFPDHYDYPSRALAKIASACGRHRPDLLVTTEKDAVKIEAAAGLFPLPTFVLRVGLELPSAFFEALAPLAARALNRHAGPS